MQTKETPHPNTVITEKVQEKGWTLEDLLRESDLHFRDFAAPKMTKLKADGLSKAFGTSPEFWLNLQANYDEWQTRDRMMNAHTIEAAMWRGELTEEEAYFVLRFAGRLGYSKAIKRLSNPIKNIRKWFVWVGGWERPELSQWDRGKPAWELFNNWNGKKQLNDPTPVSFFGHSITVQNRWLSIKCFGGWLNLMFPNYENAQHWVYWSPNGTPSHANTKVLIPKK